MQPSNLKWQWLNNIKAQEAMPIIPQVLPIPKSEVSILAAPGGVGKSFLSIRLAMEYANTHDGIAGLWLSEDAEAQVKFRQELISKRFGIKEPINKIATITVDPEPFLIRNGFGIFEPNYEALEKFTQWAAALNVTFLVIDPIINFFGGNENDNVQARAFMAPFVKWAHGTGITILFIHHSSKAGAGARGASDFVNGVKCVYTLDYPRDEDGNILPIDAKEGRRELQIIKDNLYMAKYLDEDGKKTLQVMPAKEIQVEEIPYE